MLAYGSVVTLWRPVSKNVIFEYKVPDHLRTLSFTRAQLTALAVVSQNDYHRNIYSVGPATNFGDTKRIEDTAGKFFFICFIQGINICYLCLTLIDRLRTL